MLLSQEILEHILQYVDGKTLLMCRDVSPEFEAAVNYLSKSSNIWKECYLKEKEKYPYNSISKLHPHYEGLSHSKDWAVIYETSLLSDFICSREPSYTSETKIGKEYSDIQDVTIHGDLILVLVKYNKDFSRFYKIITVSLNNEVISKSCRFVANMLYITPIEDLTSVRHDAMILSCNMCHLMAVPICADVSIKGFPKFSKVDNFLTIEHSNGDYLWISDFGKFLTKGKCFHTGKDVNHEEIKLKDSETIKVVQGYASLCISCGNTFREFNTFNDLRASVTASFIYCEILILGTNTGMLYAYHLSNESDLKELNLNCYIQNFDVCFNSILMINAMELKNEFVIVCCSEKSVYHIHMKRKLKNLG